MNNNSSVANNSNNFQSEEQEEEEEEEETAEDDETSLTTAAAATATAVTTTTAISLSSRLSRSRPSSLVSRSATAAVRPTSLQGKRYCSSVTGSCRDIQINNGGIVMAPATATTKVHTQFRILRLLPLLKNDSCKKKKKKCRWSLRNLISLHQHTDWL